VSFIEYLNMQSSAPNTMICEFVYKQISYYSSRIISDSWTNQSEKFYLITAILTSIELITTTEEKYLIISWKRSALTLNTRITESRIKLNESSIIIDIYSKSFKSKNMSYMTLPSLKCRSRSHRSRSLTRTHKENILKMSEKMSDISRSVNQLINQSQLRSIKSVNQLINRHPLFRSHSGKHLSNHSILNYHTIHSTLQSISHITSTIGRRTRTHQSVSTHFPNHLDHHTSAIKFDLPRKYLNRIHLNQFNLHLNHLNHLHSHLHSHPHLQPSPNRFTSINHSMMNQVNHSMNRINHSMTRMIDSDNWRYWIKSIKRTKNSVTQIATLILKCWNFMINVNVRDYSSRYICRVSRSFDYYSSNLQFCYSFHEFCVNIKHYLEYSEWYRVNLTRWQIINISDVVAVNSTLSLFECLRKYTSRWTLFKKIWILHLTIRFSYERTLFESAEITLHWSTNWITHQLTSLIWSITCIVMSWITKRFESNNNTTQCGKSICSKTISRSLLICWIMIRASSRINISLIDNIVVRDHLIVEKVFETKMIDFKHVISKSALYVKNPIVDQSIIQKRSERTRKSDFLIVISSTKLVKSLIVDWINT
jgi:hypothetical protein